MGPARPGSAADFDGLLGKLRGALVHEMKRRSLWSAPPSYLGIYGGVRWIDISVPVRNGMVHWPGDPPIRIWHPRHMDEGDHLTLSAMSLGSHTGTHMDAPGHFLRGARAIDTMPPSTTIGRARVIEIRNRNVITPEDIRPWRIRRGERILFKTANSTRRWPRQPFLKDFVALSVEAARLLASRKLRVVGVDYLSVGGYHDDGAAVHRALLRAGIWIIEGLDLSGVRPGTYELVCLPLRLHRGDGAPARAVIRPLRRSR